MTRVRIVPIAALRRQFHRWRERARRRPRVFVLGAALLGVPALGMVFIGGEALVRARLDPPGAQAPARFYARPFVFQSGQSLDRAELERTLDRLGYRRVRRGDLRPGEYTRSGSGWVIDRRAFRVGDWLDPGGTFQIRPDYWGDRIGGVYDASGRRLPYAALEPELIGLVHGATAEDRLPVPLADVPPSLVEAVLAIEDQRFFQHGGIDLVRVAGAALANLKAGRVHQGGSTITQQLAKNLFLSPTRSIVRKLRETAMALVLERRYDKEAILEAYLNEVYLGQDGGIAIHGVGSAAQYYFGSDLSQLGMAQAALLAAVIRGPSIYSPFRHPEAARERRDLVLRAMRDRGTLTEEEHERAVAAPLGLRSRPEPERSGRYFVDFVAAGVRSTHGDDALHRGLTVFTTLDLGLQRAAEEAVTLGLQRLEREHPTLKRTDSPLQAALVALDGRTGEVLAMVGGRDYGASQFNRAVHARRQPGSAFKPVVALSALARPRGAEDAGPRFTLASVLADEPLSVETPAGVWQPVNYDRQYRGDLTLRAALERSLNVPFARLGLAIGPRRIVETARALGIEGPLHAVPSLALGASEVTPLELARAYGVLAAGGWRAPLNRTLAVVDAGGSVISRLVEEGARAYDPAETYLVTAALIGAVERGTGRGLRSWGYRGSVAAKSGTTNDFRDGWFIGYTPTITVAVWVGFDDGRSLDLPGSRLALPIFARFLADALGPDGDGGFERPWELEIVEVDPETGLRAGPGCPGEPEVFLPGTAPRESCSPYWDGGSRRSGHVRLADRTATLIRDLLRRLEGGEH